MSFETRFSVFIIIATIFAVLQNIPQFHIAGIKPNIVMVFLVLAALYLQNIALFLIVTAALLGVLFNLFLFSLEALIFFLCLVVFFLAKKISPLSDIGNVLLAVLALTLVFAFLGGGAIALMPVGIVMGELVVNLSVAGALYALSRPFFMRRNTYA